MNMTVSVNQRQFNIKYNLSRTLKMLSFNDKNKLGVNMLQSQTFLKSIQSKTHKKRQNKLLQKGEAD